MALILSSNFPLKDNEDIVEYIKNILEIKRSKTVFISALQQVDHFEKYKENFIEYGLPTVEYFEITKEMNSDRFKSLNKFDILYLHGGDPFKISQQIRISEFNHFLSSIKNSNKIIIGTSGSTMVLSENISLLYSLYPKSKKVSDGLPDDMMGLNLFPNTVLPHYNRYKKQNSVEIIKEYSKKNKNKIYAIYDGSAIKYHQKDIEIIGKVVIFENGKEAIKS